MLTRIVRLLHIGLFHNGTPAPLQFGKTTLIYGENGRGKSTLAAVLDSCARGLPELILRRTTIDQANATPTAQLVFDRGTANVTFENRAWSSQKNEILVFDSQFVQDNAYTGTVVTSENRRGLYRFALGDAVRDVGEMDRLTAAHQAAVRLRGDRERTVIGHAGTMQIDDFLALEADADIGAKLDDARRLLEAGTRAAQIQNRQNLVQLRVPPLQLQSIFARLRRTLANVHADAEQIVREHFARHAQPGFEDWASRGVQYDRDNTCPFCGQATDRLALIRAYRDFFDQGYRNLKREITELRNGVLRQVDLQLTAEWNTLLEANRARQEAWADLVPTEALAIDNQAATEHLRGLRDGLAGLFDRKAAAPLEPIGTDAEQQDITARFDALTGLLRGYNDRLTQINERYTQRKREVAAADLVAIDSEIRRLQIVQRRFAANVVDDAQRYLEARDAAVRALQEKDTAREHHDRTMAETFARYQTAINRWLTRLRAGFQVMALEGVHDAGQRPRTMWAIQLRGHEVRALDDANDRPSFPTALSDGDRRSLALAFFLARLDLDTGLANRIVVFDDPMTSFDENRTKETVRALVGLTERCDQVIVLSHNAHFLRDILDAERKAGRASVTKKIRYAANNYADFEDCDLVQMCSQLYFERFLSAVQYMNGTYQGDPRRIAENVRMLVEEYYKRRYPNDIAGDRTTLGGIIEASRNAAAPSPLVTLQPLLEHLEDFNHYASQYHHENPQHATVQLNESELRHYVEGALSLIYDDGQTHPIVVT